MSIFTRITRAIQYELYSRGILDRKTFTVCGKELSLSAIHKSNLLLQLALDGFES